MIVFVLIDKYSISHTFLKLKIIFKIIIILITTCNSQVKYNNTNTNNLYCCNFNYSNINYKYNVTCKQISVPSKQGRKKICPHKLAALPMRSHTTSILYLLSLNQHTIQMSLPTSGLLRHSFHQQYLLS